MDTQPKNDETEETPASLRAGNTELDEAARIEADLIKLLKTVKAALPPEATIKETWRYKEDGFNLSNGSGTFGRLIPQTKGWVKLFLYDPKDEDADPKTGFHTFRTQMEDKEAITELLKEAYRVRADTHRAGRSSSSLKTAVKNVIDKLDSGELDLNKKEQPQDPNNDVLHYPPQKQIKDTELRQQSIQDDANEAS